MRMMLGGLGWADWARKVTEKSAASKARLKKSEIRMTKPEGKKDPRKAEGIRGGRDQLRGRRHFDFISLFLMLQVGRGSRSVKNCTARLNQSQLVEFFCPGVNEFAFKIHSPSNK